MLYFIFFILYLFIVFIYLFYLLYFILYIFFIVSFVFLIKSHLPHYFIIFENIYIEKVQYFSIIHNEIDKNLIFQTIHIIIEHPTLKKRLFFTYFL